MKTSLKQLTFLLMSAAALVGAHHGHMDKDGKAMAKDAMKADTVVDVAVASPDHTTLVAAVKAAGLVETLSGEGPFTIFAPTDEAFAKLPDGTLDMLLKPENKDQLVSILTYHVVPANVPASAVEPGNVPTVNGSMLPVSVDYGTVKVGDAKVTATDLKAKNGVVHVIDTVLLP
ncbi:MAG: fasciclin domain-containing protein [Opitutales bacterium]